MIGDITKEWCLKMAETEGDASIAAGTLTRAPIMDNTPAIDALQAENELLRAELRALCEALDADREMTKQVSDAVKSLHSETAGPHEGLCYLCGELYGADAVYFDDGRRLCAPCDDARQALEASHEC